MSLNLKIINLDLLLNIKMLKRKIILAFFILLIIFQIGFFVSSGDPPQEDPELTLIQQLDALKNEGNLDYVISEDEEFITLFLNEGDFEFGENSVENLVSSEGYSRSTVKMDMSGNVIAASLYNEAKAKQIINGNEFEVPEDGYLEYGKDVYELASRTKINNLSSGSTIIGNDIDFFGEFLLKKRGGKDDKSSGKCYYSDSSYLLEYGIARYNGLEITPDFEEKVLIVTDLLTIPSQGINYIKETKDNSLKIQTYENSGSVRINFLEGNGFVDMNSENLEGNKEKMLSVEVGQGDSVEIFDRSEYFSGGLPPKIIHTSNNGFTIIKPGRHIFKLKDGKLIENFGNLNTKNFEVPPLDIISDIEEISGKIIEVDDNNRYIINDFEVGNILTFDSSPNQGLGKKFTSVENEKLYNYAEEQIGNAAFRHGGRGDTCYTLEKGIYLEEKSPTGDPVFDCVGLPIMGLLEEVYPDSSIRDFDPNLKLFGFLEKEKGWESHMVEPSSVIGKIKTSEAIKNIPAGAIVYSLSPTTTRPLTGTEGIDYFKYINKKNEEVYLEVGHTLVKGKEDYNFINAKPGHYPYLLPKNARKLNEQLALEGEEEYFQGAVKEGTLEFIENSYFYCSFLDSKS